MRNKFKKIRSRSNLLRHHESLLDSLRQSTTHIVFPSDKNLGPVIVERSIYIQRALQDHLLNKNTYKRLSPHEAHNAITTTIRSINWFLFQYRHLFTKQELKYLQQSLKVPEPHSEFYILAKVHKDPWGTRPIVLTCGSILEGLGRWTDFYLQPLCRNLPCYIRDSTDFVGNLQSLPPLPSTARMFTADAIGMYTNIDTNHAISVLPGILPATPRGHALLAALKIIMTRNTFKFGDTFWHQLHGTAMGSPPAPPYATLYYAVNEQYLLHRYKKHLLFYRRFIDDVFGIWNFDGDESMAMWLAFQTDLSFGTLHWTVNTPSHTCIFLDLSLRLEHGKIYTTLYEKELNLHLYLPPDSCHPPGVLKGLVFGAFHRVLSLTNSRPDQIDILRRLSQNLLRRGYRHKLISNLFRAAYYHY